MTTISVTRCFSRNILRFRRFYSINRKHYFQSQILATQHARFNRFARQENLIQPKYVAVKFYATNNKNDPSTEKGLQPEQDTVKVEKLGLFKRFQQMFRDYWYVMVPVHLVTSAGWFGGFYYMAKCGVDVAALLQSIGFSESLINPLRDSSMGYLAVSYAFYEIATPLRYAVTLSGTTILINYLKKWGYIKPVPSKAQIKEMYKEGRDHIRDTIQEKKEELRQRKDQLKERKENIMDEFGNFKKEFKDIKTNIRKRLLKRTKNGKNRKTKSNFTTISTT